MEFLVQCLELSWALNDREGELGERTQWELLIWCVASWYMKPSEIPALAAAQEWGWYDPQTAFTNKWLYVGCVHRRVSELNNFTIQRNGSGSSSYWWLSRSMPQCFFREAILEESVMVSCLWLSPQLWGVFRSWGRAQGWSTFIVANGFPSGLLQVPVSWHLGWLRLLYQTFGTFG